jgi:hypothetical protein
MQLINEIACCIANCIRIYNYPLIFSVNRKLTGFTTCFPKLNRYHVTGAQQKDIFPSVTVYNKNLFSQYNLTAQIESVQDKFN